MKPEMMAFLKQGLKSYGEARHTLALFDRKLKELLSAAVQSRPDWSPMSQQRIGKFSAGGNEDGWWICSEISGRSPHDEKVVVDCGIWWRSPNDDEPILYASFFYEPKRVKKFNWPATKQRIESFEYDSRTILYLPAPETLEFEEPLNLLLDALLPHLNLKQPHGVRATKEQILAKLGVNSTDGFSDEKIDKKLLYRLQQMGKPRSLSSDEIKVVDELLAAHVPTTVSETPLPAAPAISQRRKKKKGAVDAEPVVNHAISPELDEFINTEFHPGLDLSKHFDESEVDDGEGDED